MVKSKVETRQIWGLKLRTKSDESVQETVRDFQRKFVPLGHVRAPGSLMRRNRNSRRLSAFMTASSCGDWRFALQTDQKDDMIAN